MLGTIKRRHRRIIRGYTRVPNVVLLDRRLSSDARWIYILLKTHDRPGKGECWPGQERLAELSCWETRNGQPDRWRVQRALDELEKACMITRQRGGARRTNTYYLCPVPDELPAIALSPMRNDGVETARKPSSDLCASDAQRSEAGFPSKNGSGLRNGAQQGNGLQNELSSQNLPQLCAQRNISSLRGVGDASSQTCVRENEEIAALDLDGFLKNSARLRENAEKFEENEPVWDDEIPEVSNHQGYELRPMLGRRLGDDRWQCEHCGWIGPSSELLPRHFEGEPWLTYLCPSCRWLRGMAILEHNAGERSYHNAGQDDSCSDRDGGRYGLYDDLVLERVP